MLTWWLPGCNHGNMASPPGKNVYLKIIFQPQHMLSLNGMILLSTKIHVLKLMDKKMITFLLSNILLFWPYA